MKENKPTPTPALENESRRKAVKTIVGGVTVLAAYHAMPVKWGTPIIEQVFLPAHAATSGSSLHDPCTVTHTDGPEDTFLVEGYVTPPTEGLPTTIVLTPTPGSPQTTTTTTLADGTFSATITIASGSDRVDVTTTVEGADGTASCFSVKPEEDIPHTLEAARQGKEETDDVLLEFQKPDAPGLAGTFEVTITNKSSSPAPITESFDLDIDGEKFILRLSTSPNHEDEI